MKVNSVNSNPIRVRNVQPQFKAQMNLKDIKCVVASLETLENYNKYEKIPQLYTILNYVKNIPAKVLRFEYGSGGLGLVLDSKCLDEVYLEVQSGAKAPWKLGPWYLLHRNFIEGDNNCVTTHARMPKSVFEQKWFCENLNKTVDDVYKLASDWYVPSI